MYATIQIQDQGPGIDREHQKHIFEPFFTTKKIGQGTGLGLPICKKIIEEHGGMIAASNRAKAGARLMIRLPVIQENPGEE